MAITSHFKLKAIVDRASMHINRRASEHYFVHIPNDRAGTGVNLAGYCKDAVAGSVAADRFWMIIGDTNEGTSGKIENSMSPTTAANPNSPKSPGPLSSDDSPTVRSMTAGNGPHHDTLLTNGNLVNASTGTTIGRSLPQRTTVTANEYAKRTMVVDGKEYVFTDHKGIFATVDDGAATPDSFLGKVLHDRNSLALIRATKKAQGGKWKNKSKHRNRDAPYHPRPQDD